MPALSENTKINIQVGFIVLVIGRVFRSGANYSSIKSQGERNEAEIEELSEMISDMAISGAEQDVSIKVIEAQFESIRDDIAEIKAFLIKE